MPKKTKKQTKPLTGQALLTKVKTLNDLTREEKAKVCGYSSVGKNGKERINIMAFLNELLTAEGINLDQQPNHGRHSLGKQASYKLSVQTNGTLLIGPAYTRQLDLKPGDEFQIMLGRKHIHLKKVEQE